MKDLIFWCFVFFVLGFALRSLIPCRRHAWMADNGENENRKYLTFDPNMGMFVWILEKDLALQLSRREDLELLVQDCEDPCHLRLHVFKE